ncbi:barttin [Sminthopsis crassicaudata]|uniref:barttin n=1 Tax=Sminthopsis crassicaudata TaxID=9301 RepID=UPI003D68CA3E
MAEEKTFRNGFIILGLFLLAVGMFIMTADRPQVYITFCVMGGIMLVSGVTWSMCQCYPKIAFIPADTDFESFLSPKARGSGESDGPEKKGSQPPYSRLEEEEVSMQSPPDYHHIQMKVFGSGEDQGVLSAPQAEPQAGREGRGPYSEAFMETAAVVHVVEAESHQGRPQASQVPAAPLASFRDELDSSGGNSSRDPSPPEEEEPWARPADAQPDRYPDFALIDAAGADEEAGLSPGPSQGTPPRFWPRPPAGPAAPKDEASEGDVPDSGEATELAPEEPEEEEEDLYYGLKDGPGGALEEEELFDFEPDS